jgi:asparagine synthase (glutamine-hydrolysing)
VEYSEKAWKKWYESDKMRKYEVFSSGLASLPHFQDWPAVMELRNKG